MISEFNYVGSELHLFSKVKNWKKYVFSEVEKNLPGNLVSIEIGSGIGSNSSYIAEVSNEYIGIEPDARLLETAKSVDSEKIFLHGYSSIIPTLKITKSKAVFYIDVLEHILEDRKELSEVDGYLSLGDYLVILVPAHMTLYSNFDSLVGHHRRYSKRTLLSILPSDFVVLEIKELDSVGGLLSFSSKFLRIKNGVNTRSVAIWNLLVPLSKFVDRFIKNRFGKSILLIARKESIG